MKKELMNKTEEKLFKYYNDKKKIHKLERMSEDLEEQIKKIDNQIRNVHNYITLDTDLPAVGTGERVQTSRSGSSYMEKQMEEEVTKLEKRKADKIKEKINLENKIMDIQSFIRSMETNLEYLSEEDKRLIEFIYGSKKKVPYVADKLNMSLCACYRRKDDILINISQFMWIFEKEEEIKAV